LPRRSRRAAASACFNAGMAVGTTVNICYECVDLCNGMIAEERVWREALRHLDLGRVLHKQESCLTCSFCGKSQDARKLIAGPTVYICSECVQRCTDVREQRERA